MKKGDHITVSHTFYQHHAIYMGNGRVIQYGGGSLRSLNTNKIECIDFEDFAAGGKVSVIESPVIFPPEEIIERAQRRIGEKEYLLFTNNCEHFVYWCRTGKAKSRQVDRLKRSLGSSPVKIEIKPCLKTGIRSLGRIATPALVIADVA